MSGPYRAGIIGTGGVAGLGSIGVHEEDSRPTASHAGGYEVVDEVKLVAAADVDSHKLESFCDSWGISTESRYSDHQSMLAAEELDVVSVCTPALYHFDHVRDVADSGVDVVLCEKPIASSISEAEEMIEICDSTDTDLVINHTLRFTEKFQQLREHIRSGDVLGEVYSVTVQSRMELVRNASHVIDLLQFLFEEDVDTVWGHVTGENESVESLSADVEVDDAAGRAMFTLGDTNATVDCTIPREHSSISYRFIGSKGRVSIDLDVGEWDYWKLEDGDHIPADMPNIDKPWTWGTDYEQGFENAVSHVVNRLNGDEQTLSTGRDAIKSLEVLIAIFISHYTGARVTLPIDRPFENIEIRSW